MALQVWLPLNGNLNNQGLWDTTFTNDNTTTITSSTGKVTSNCYQRATKLTNGLIKSSGTINLNNDFSMCCWAYVMDTVGDTANGLISNHSYVDNTGCGITVKQVSTSDYRISCNTGNGSSRTFNTYYGKTNIKNAWHHLCLTYNKVTKVLRLFVNGIEEYTLTNYTNASKSDYILLFDWSTTFTSNSYRPACKLNDVRIYDHCLSQKEIKELSKGLCLHYKLSNQYEMNVKNLYSGETAKGSDSYRNGITKTQNPDGSYKYILNYTGVGSNNWPASGFPAFNFTANKKYLYSVKVKCNSTTGNFTFNFRPSRCGNDYAAGKDNVLVNDGTWHEYYYVQTIPSTLSGTASTTPSPRLEFYTSNLNGNGTSYKFDIDIKDCLITETNNYIPFIDNSMTSNSVTDCSGYGNDGTINGTLTYSNDTPRYEGSTFISSGGILGSRKFPDNVESITLSAWVKSSNIASQDILGNWENGGCGIYINSSKKAVFEYFDGSAYKTCIGTTMLQNDTWYFITCVFSYADKKAYIYVNGILETSAVVSTYIRIGGATNVPMSIGNPSSTTVGNITNYYVSDARVYATALSAEDVKALYNTPISIDNHKNLHCMELEQTNNQTSFCKSGVAKMELLPIPEYTYTCQSAKTIKIWESGSQLKLNDVHKIRVIFRSRGDGTPTSSKCSSISCAMFESSWKWSVNTIWWSSATAYSNIGKIIDYTGSLTINSTMTSTTTNIAITLYWLIQSYYGNGSDNQTHDLYYYKYWNATTGEVYAQGGTPEYDRITTNDFMEI